MNQKRVSMLALALLLPLGGAACGDSSTPAREPAAANLASAGVRACDVLTQADAEKALGHKVEQLPSSGGPAGLDLCQYGYQGERIADTGNVTVTLKPVDIGSLRQGVVDAGGSAEAVPGLGDSAFWSADYGLYVGKDNRTAIYLIGGRGITDPKASAIALAGAPVARF